MKIIKGPSIKYVTLFLANFSPPPSCHTLSHIPGPPRKYVTHLGPPRFLEGLVQKTRTKAPCTNSVSIVRGRFCPGGFGRGSFVWKVLSGWFLSVPVLSEYTCYIRKLNITLNFMFRMYDKKSISVTSHALYPPLSQTVPPSRTPPQPSSVTYFMDGPYIIELVFLLTWFLYGRWEIFEVLHYNHYITWTDR